MSPYLLTFRLVVNEAKWHCFLVKMSLICMTMNIMFISIILQNAFMQQEVFTEPFICDIGAIYFVHSFVHFYHHIASYWNIYCRSNMFSVQTYLFFSYLFVFILVPRFSGKEQLLVSFVKMTEPESIGGGTNTDHHDNKLVKVGFHTIYRIVKC